MLRLGLDFYGTVDTAPKAYRKLAQAVISSGGQVHVISAVMAGNERKLRLALRRTHLPYTSLEVVVFSSVAEIPALKRRVIKSLNLDIYIDDNRDNILGISDLPVVGLLVY